MESVTTHSKSRNKGGGLGLTLTPAERGHLLSLLYWNELSGEYAGNRAHWWKRAARIRKKLHADW